MTLKYFELDLKWPEDVPLGKLRHWIIPKLSEHGEPLRWAITDIQASSTEDQLCNLRVEVVVITHC